MSDGADGDQGMMVPGANMNRVVPKREAAYAIAMGVAAAVLAGATAYHGALPRWYELTGFVLAACLLASRTIRLSPTLGTVSVGFVFVFATLVELGPVAGVVAAAGSALSGALLCHRRRRPRPVVVLVALSSIVLSAGVAGWAYVWLDAVCSDLGVASGVLSVFVVIGVYYMANSMGVALMASADGRKSVIEVWSDALSWTALPFYVGGAAVMVVHVVAAVVGPLVWLVLIPVTAAVHFAMAIRARGCAGQPAPEATPAQCPVGHRHRTG